MNLDSITNYNIYYRSTQTYFSAALFFKALKLELLRHTYQ